MLSFVEDLVFEAKAEADIAICVRNMSVMLSIMIPSLLASILSHKVSKRCIRSL